MKRTGLILAVAFGLCAIGCSAACIFVSAKANENIAVLAESTFEQKTYVYEDEVGKVTLVLISETEFSLTIDEETKYGTYVRNGDILTLTMGENSLDVEINDILGTFGEPKSSEVVETGTEQNEESKIIAAAKWIEERIVPLFGGVSVISILSSIAAGVSAFLKVRSDRKSRALILIQDKKIEALEEANKAYSKKLADVEEQYISIAKSATQLVEVSKNMCAAIEQQSVRIENVERMKGAVEISCNLIAKALALTDAAVKSGIAEDAQALVATFQGGNPNGEESEAA